MASLCFLHCFSEVSVALNCTTCKFGINHLVIVAVHAPATRGWPSCAASGILRESAVSTAVLFHPRLYSGGVMGFRFSFFMEEGRGDGDGRTVASLNALFHERRQFIGRAAEAAGVFRVLDCVGPLKLKLEASEWFSGVQ
jgi:hypothetical protein